MARILQGVHYPSDNLGAINLSNALFNKLHPILKKEPQWTEYVSDQIQANMCIKLYDGYLKSLNKGI
jgi:hypothetical protein